MKPLKLQLQGFGCFREPTEVSFDDLELFAISGPTGAGKSTLLDAVTYALYGQTARVGQQVKDTLFSPGLEQLSVSLEFRVGAAETYRVTRVSERKGGRAPKNETRIERLGEGASWYQLAESEKLKEAGEKLQKIVGLDYSSFTRAVLLPQGDFDQFLRGSANERIKLLTSLLGLERVEAMQQLAGETARGARERERGLRERLEADYAGATPERRGALKRELGALEAQQRELEAQGAALGQQLAELSELAGLWGELRAAQRRLEGLVAQRVEVAAARAALGRARSADRLLPALDDLEAQRARLEAARTKVAALSKRLEDAETGLARAQRGFEVAAAGQARLSELGARLEALAEVRPLMGRLKTRGGDLSLAVAGAEPYEDGAWDAGWDELQALAAELPGLRRAQGDAEEAQQAVARAQRSLSETEGTLAALEHSLERRLEDGKAARALLDARREALREAQRQDQAAALREHLHPGEACPVCEQTVRARPPERESRVTPLQTAFDEAERRCEALREAYREEQARLKALGATRSDRQEALERAQEAQARAAARLEAAEAAFRGWGTADAADLGRRLETRRCDLLARLAAHIAGRTGGTDPETASAALARERHTLESAFREAQATLHAAQAARETARAEAHTAAAHQRELEAEATGAEGRFTGLLTESDFGDAQAVRAAVLSETRQRELAARTERHAKELEAAEGERARLETKLTGRTFDEGALARARAEQAEVAGALAGAQRRFGELSGELAHLEVQLEKAKELREAARRAREVGTVYNVLDKELQTRRFPTYLLERVQRELAQRASSILKEVTEARYDLRFSGGEYSVMDAWNGEVRGARTLSGGESFITSLALALALSDTLAGSTALGALFLDEGFGTLDAETLDAVAEVLETLTKTGRMVGIITHVRELTERLPARLEVSKTPSGSVVAWHG